MTQNGKGIWEFLKLQTPTEIKSFKRSQGPNATWQFFNTTVM